MSRTIFDASMARTYEDTRRVSPKEVETAFREALRGVPTVSTARVLDVGCGTGRLLRCLVPKVFSAKQVVAIDTSPAMLRKVREKPALNNVQTIPTSIFDFEPADRRKFDVIICHWFFHCVAPWHAAALACLRLIKKSGALVWLDEDGDLYRALDNMESPTPHNPAQPVYDLFSAYFQEVTRALGKTRDVVPAPRNRIGTELRNRDALDKFLQDCGWKVASSRANKSSWNDNVKVSWILDNVLKPRAFTNLRAIPPAVHVKALRELDRRLGHGNLPTRDDQFPVQYTWAGQYAMHDGGVTTKPEEAARAILQVTHEIGPYALTCYPKQGRRVKTNKYFTPYLREFFTLLFNPITSDLWKSFWSTETKRKSATPNAPLWVWVRLSTGSAESFSAYLDSSIFRTARSPELLDDLVVETYFESTNTFISLVKYGLVRLEPVAFNISSEDKNNGWSAKRSTIDEEGRRPTFIETRNAIFIKVPRSFIGEYCLRHNEMKPFTKQAWKNHVTPFRTKLLKRKGSSIELNRLRAGLFELGNGLDRELTRNRFGGEGGLKSVIELIQAVALFQGNSFYLFPVPRLGGEVGGSITIGSGKPLSDLQILTLQEIAEELLLLPSVILSAST